MTRRRISKAARAKLFEVAGGKCCLCGIPITEKLWIVEHLHPLFLDGSNATENLGPAHVGCAKVKTRKEAKVRAKIKRLKLSFASLDSAPLSLARLGQATLGFDELCARKRKVRRLRAGGRKRKGRPLAGTIASGLRKRMDGTVERR
jgi:hypothetical protein